MSRICKGNVENTVKQYVDGNIIAITINNLTRLCFFLSQANVASKIKIKGNNRGSKRSSNIFELLKNISYS